MERSCVGWRDSWFPFVSSAARSKCRRGGHTASHSASRGSGPRLYVGEKTGRFFSRLKRESNFSHAQGWYKKLMERQGVAGQWETKREKCANAGQVILSRPARGEVKTRPVLCRPSFSHGTRLKWKGFSRVDGESIGDDVQRLPRGVEAVGALVGKLGGRPADRSSPQCRSARGFLHSWRRAEAVAMLFRRVSLHAASPTGKAKDDDARRARGVSLSGS